MHPVVHRLDSRPNSSRKLPPGKHPPDRGTGESRCNLNCLTSYNGRNRRQTASTTAKGPRSVPVKSPRPAPPRSAERDPFRYRFPAVPGGGIPFLHRRGTNYPGYKKALGSIIRTDRFPICLQQEAEFEIYCSYEQSDSYGQRVESTPPQLSKFQFRAYGLRES